MDQNLIAETVVEPTVASLEVVPAIETVLETIRLDALLDAPQFLADAVNQLGGE